MNDLSSHEPPTKTGNRELSTGNCPSTRRGNPPTGESPRPPWRNPRSRLDSPVTTTDIVILGAGVIGASIAFHLARRHAGKIVVVDKGHVGQGGSGRIAGPVVVAATGPWTRALFQAAGLDIPIETEYHQVAILKNPPDMKGGGCACIDSVTATYFRSEAHDKFLVGDFYGRRDADPDNFPQRAADHELEEIIERACRRVPKLENAEVMRGVTGIYDMTPDSRPLLGSIPGVRGCTPAPVSPAWASRSLPPSAW